MARLTHAKRASRVTRRPPVDQRVQPRPSRPSVPNRSRYHSWPLSARTTAKTMANSGPKPMKIPHITAITANGRKRLHANRAAFSRKEPSPTATTTR